MPKVALIHDWLIAQRGGEHVLQTLIKIYPQADIFTLVHKPGSVTEEIEARPIYTSYIQRMPGGLRHFRKWLPLFPHAIESFNLSRYDLIVSTSHCVAKGVLSHPNQLHLSYVHSPMRYLYDQLPEYLPRRLSDSLWAQRIAYSLSAPLREWDRRSSRRGQHFFCNSNFVAKRISRVWGVEAKVIYPPVRMPEPESGEVDTVQPSRLKRTGFLVVSALVPYKRVERAVKAALYLDVPLTIIGRGGELKALRLMSQGRGRVQFLQNASDDDVQKAYRLHKALLFCGTEDFGIVPLEAMAQGCPVLALAEGGALETVIDGQTGHLFYSDGEFLAAIKAIDCGDLVFDESELKKHAQTFSEAHFIKRWKDATSMLM